MKLLLSVLLLSISTLAYGAHSPSSAFTCSDFITKANSNNPKCAPVRTDVSVSDVTHNSVRITGTGDLVTAGSTHYYYVSPSAYPPGCTDANYQYADLSSSNSTTVINAKKFRQGCMNWRYITEGQGSTIYGKKSEPLSGNFVTNISGLSPSTTYYIHEFHKGGVNGLGKISVIETHRIITDATPVDPEVPVGEQLVVDGGASSRFFDSVGGNDLNDCMSHNTRCATFTNKVTCNLAPGTNIALLNTSVFTGPGSVMNICYNSTDQDWALIGSYKLNVGGSAVWTIDNVRGAGTTDQKAKFLGPITNECIAARTCDYRTSAFIASGLSSSYSPRVYIDANHVKFMNIAFEKQLGYDWIVAGSGNTFYGDSSEGSTNHVIIDGIDSYQAGPAANVFVDGVRDIVYRNSTVDTWGLCYQLRSLGNSPSLTDEVCPPVAVPSAGGIVRSYNARALVENNDFYKGWGEGGVDCGNHTSHVIYRGNRHYGSTSVGQYMDGCANVVVENAILVGGNDHGLVGAGNTGPGENLSAAISVGIEDWHSLNEISPSAVIRNNLQVRPAKCYDLFISIPHTNSGRTISVKAFGNSCVGPTVQDIQFWQGTVLDMVFKSNLFWNQTVNYCNLPSSTVSANNHSYATRTDPDCVGTNATTGDPLLATSYSSWTSFKGPSSWPTFANAKPQANSPLIGTGVSSTATILDWNSYGFGATEMADFKAGLISPENWVKERYYDALNVPVGASPPRGAVCGDTGCDIVTPPPPPPPPPVVGERLVASDGAVKFVGNGGNNANSGNDHANRWEDFTNVNTCALASGTNIAILNTSVFNVKEMTICHPGLENNRNLVASYKLNGSGQPVWAEDLIKGPGTTDQKAEFRGGLTQECLEAGTCNFAESFPVETFSDHYDCVVKVTSAADYTTIQNIAINKQRWCPFSMKGDSNSDRNLISVIADGIDFADNGDGHMHLFYLTGAVARNFTILRANTCYMQRSKSGASGSVTGCSGPWGGALPVIGSRQVLIENNWTDDTFGEVYQPFNDNAYIIIRNNFSGNSLTVCVYGDSSRYTVIENNICNLKDNVNVGYSTVEAYRTAIEQNMEYYGAGVPPPGSNDYVTVRNNLIVNANAAYSNEQYTQIIDTDPSTTRVSSGWLNGNTIIGATTNAINFWSYNAYTLARVPFFYAKNNAIWSPDLTAWACTWRQSHSAVDITYSHWDAVQIGDTDCNGVGDTIGDPLLSVSNINTWKAYEAKIGNPATFEYARPTANSPLAGSGVVSENVIYNWADFGMAATEMADYKSGAISSTHWVKERYYDALNEPLGPTPPKGAVCPTTGCTVAPTPSVPATALTISPNGRYFRKNGVPFNWVGCTAWIGSYLSNAKIDEYLTDRAGRGCNVVHGFILNNLGKTITDAEGPISSTSPYTMRSSTFTSKIDYFVSRATALGMNIAFPVCWGPNCTRDFVENANNAATYTDFLVSRYSSYPNILWLASGEYTKMADNPPDYLPSGENMTANEIAILDRIIARIEVNKHPYSLSSLHPDGWRSSRSTYQHPGREFGSESWADYSNIQSASSNYQAVTLTLEDYAKFPIKPTVLDESNYEGANFGAWETRLQAWSTRLSGSAGYTYGHSLIWLFSSGWEAQLGAEGAVDIFTHFKSFWDTFHDEGLIESRGWLTGDKGDLTTGVDTYEAAMRSADGSKLIVYSPKGNNINVVTNNITGTVRARWFDPRNGGYTAIADPVTKSADTTFDPPGVPAINNDWVLVLD